MTFSPYRSLTLIGFGNFMFRYRNAVFPIALATLLVALPPGPVWGGDWADPRLDAAALFLAFAGGALRILTVGLEYIKRGGVNKRIYASTLVTEGMFGHCRNPLYVGNVMMAVALLAVAGRYGMLVVGVPLILLTYIAIVAAEETYLHNAFPGDYEAYCRATNRWIPDLRGLGETLRGARFNWRRVLLKESSGFYCWIAVAFLLNGVKYGFSIAQPGFQAFLSLFVAATLGFTTIRLLKRTRRLQL